MKGSAGVEPTKKISFVWNGVNEKCEGKDGINFTIASSQDTDAKCSQSSALTTGANLIAHQENGEKSVINIAILANSVYPAGGLHMNLN